MKDVVTVELVDPRDAVFAYVEKPTAEQSMLTAYAFAPQSNRADILQWVTERANRIALLRQRLVRVPFDLDHPYWADDPDFAPSDHVVFHADCDWPGLRTILADVMQTPMDWSRPLWELHVIEGVTGVDENPDPVTVAVLKAHHSVLDGSLGMHVARQLFAEALLPDIETDQPPRIPSRFTMTARAIGSSPRMHYRLAGALPATQRSKQLLAAEREQGVYKQPAPLRPRTVFNQALGPERVFDSVFFSLPELKSMREELGDVTINDLLLAMVGGALYKYLVEFGGTPDGSLGAGVPMSTRETIEAISQNQFVNLTVDLHTDIEDPVERARLIHQSVIDDRVRKTRPGPIAADAVFRSIPGFFIRNGLRIITARPAKQSPKIVLANALITNVPRCAADLKLCGSTVVANLGLTPQVGLGGVAHSIGSIGDSLVVNFTGDPHQLRDNSRYAELLRESFDDLKAAIHLRMPICRDSERLTDPTTCPASHPDPPSSHD